MHQTKNNDVALRDEGAPRRHLRTWTRVAPVAAQVWGDAGYQGVDKRPGNRGLDVEWQVAMRPGQRQLEPESPEAVSEKRKASVRAKVEHPFLYISGTSATPRSATGDCPRTRAADDAAGVCQLDEGRTVPGGVKPCISAPKIRPRRRNALSGPVVGRE